MEAIQHLDVKETMLGKCWRVVGQQYQISLILLANNSPTFAQHFCQRKRAQHVGRQHCWSNVGEMLAKCWARLRWPLATE